MWAIGPLLAATFPYLHERHIVQFLILRFTSFNFTHLESFFLEQAYFVFIFKTEIVFLSNEGIEELGKSQRSLKNVALHLPAVLNFEREVDY